MSFALLDDCTATATESRSRLYTQFVREIRCVDAARITQAWEEVQIELAAGGHAGGLCGYEFGESLIGLTDALTEAGDGLRFLIYREYQSLSADDVDAWLGAQTPGNVTAGLIDLEPNL